MIRILLVVLLVVPTLAAGAEAPPQVGRWERFELAVENPRSYADPYRDVVLDATAPVHRLADPGRTYLVYFETPGAAQLRLEGGPYAVEWIDARNPAARRRGKPVSGEATLHTPGGGDDWILQLERR